MKTYKVPVVKVIYTAAYIKCDNALMAEILVRNMNGILSIDGDVEEVNDPREGRIDE